MFVCRLASFSGSKHITPKNTSNRTYQLRNYAKETPKTPPAKPATPPPTTAAPPTSAGATKKQEFSKEEFPLRAQIEEEFRRSKAAAGPTFDPEKVKNAPKLRDKVYREILKAPIIPSEHSLELYSLAEQAGELKELETEILRVLVVLTDREEALKYRLNGLVNIEELSRPFLEEMKSAFNLSESLYAYLDNLIGRNLFSEVVDTLKGFIKEITEKRREAYASITTATAALPEQYKEALKQLQKEMGSTEKLEVEHIVDPSIEGGYILTVPGGIHDVSVKKRWQEFVSGYIEDLKKSFVEKPAQPSPKQQKLLKEWSEVFGGAEKVPDFLKQL